MEDGPLPHARIVTSLGEIVVELRPDCAPRSVAAFIAEAQAGTYNSGRFGRVVRAENDNASPPIHVVQAVGRRPDAFRADVELETTLNSGLRHEDGAISLPRYTGGRSIAQSFFICVGDQPALDAGGTRIADGLGFAVFGRVVAGIDTVRAISGLPIAEGQIPTDPPLISSMTIG